MPSTATSILDGLSTSVAIKPPVAAVSTVNLTLAGYQTVGGVAITFASQNKRTLVNAQTNPAENGIYVQDTGNWQRAKDFDGNRDVVNGTLVVAPIGSEFFYYKAVCADPVVIGTTPITFETVTVDVDTSIAVEYDAADAVALNLHDYIEDAGSYQLMGFVPQNLKAAIRDGSSTTDISTYLQNCIDAVRDERGKGCVSLPMGKVTIATSIQARDAVSIRGAGGRASIIQLDGCDGITIGFQVSEGSLVLRDFGIHGVSGTTMIGINQTGTLDDADETYGITLCDLFITSVNTIARFRAARNLWIERVWGQSCDTGFDLSGKNLVVRIHHSQLVRGAGVGSGDNTALILDGFNFTGGSGLVAPEGVQVSACQFYGFDIGVDARFANVVNLDMLDIDAREYGIKFSTVQDQFNISKTFIAMQSATALYGIYGEPLSAGLNAKVNIDKYSILGTASAVNCGGVKINSSGAGNQDHVTIRDGLVRGMSTQDIIVENAGETTIENNRCMSTGATNSISVPNVISGTVHIDRNTCEQPVSFVAAEAASGEIRMGVNMIEGVRQYGTQHVPTVVAAAALTLPQGSNIFHISGTTNITSIVTTGWTGREVTLIFDGTLTLTDGSNLKLVANYVTASNGTIRLVCDGTNWYAAGGPSANG